MKLTLPVAPGLLTVLGLAQRRRVDLSREPWGGIMDTIQAQGDAAAQQRLEQIGARGEGPAWERAHAYRWAGQLAARSRRVPDARRDFEAARRLDPDGYDGGMAAVHLAELAAREGRWREAERLLALAGANRDASVRAYAAALLQPVAARTQRLRLRAVAWPALGLAAVALAGFTAWSLRRRAHGRHAPAPASAAVTRLAAVAAVAAIVLFGVAVGAGVWLWRDHVWWSVARPVL